MRLIHLIAVTCGATLFCLGLLIPALADAPAEASDRSEIASTGTQSCRASLEINRDTSSLYYSGGCPEPIAAKAAGLDALLDTLFGESGVPESVRTLRIGWARRFSEELALRIAQHASESPGWKVVLAKRSERGRGDHGLVSGFVARLIHEKSLYKEIGRALHKHGAIVVAVRTEKPFVGPASLTHSAGWLLERGIAPDQLLPLDAIIDLVLEPAPGASQSDIRY